GQAEDRIRDRDVTGVQTCALPISWCSWPLFRLRGQEHHVLAAAVPGDGMDRLCLVVDGGHDIAAGGDEVLGTVAFEIDADAFVRDRKSGVEGKGGCGGWRRRGSGE